MRKIKSLLLLFIVLSFTTAVQAQTNEVSAFEQTMRGNGRIYVVIAVMTTILVGLFLYLIRLDRKISKLEKN
ncbi:CcmD family protein [Terrimonas sp. NA20]|uniref:CcmD family protein n=1 Tax=Terrimonas ginsenosidimutans TaxID=2908004 RepID=A0ABS9KU85_9BACT|nr:CcmD family protein [Terrimonas ginsenosidimutans]MCG2615890.1 CcmD family protein [Terrimonas ginsenosidimutans]